jgi:hypothetical protein
MPVSAKGGRYHHGDLPAALVDAAIDLIAGVDKSRYPELQRAWAPVDALLAVVQEICVGDVAAADALATALEAIAHGYAVMLLEDEPAAGPQEIAAAADRAAAATLAMIAGRAALTPRS